MTFLLLAIGSAFLFALTFYFRKQVGQDIPVLTAYFIETCIQMVVVTSVFFLFQKNGLGSVSKGGWFAVLAGFAVVCGVLLNYFALRNGFLSKVTAITSPAQIIFGAIIGFLLISESISLTQILGIVLSIGGILLIIR